VFRSLNTNTPYNFFKEFIP